MSKSSKMDGIKITIIGGGASGITAAIAAARVIGGNQVRIIEKNDIIGRKLLATGNGRCNFTNLNCMSNELMNNVSIHKNNGNFTETALSRFSVNDTLDFFNSIGILPREEAEGRIYPYSEQASSIQEAFQSELEYLGVQILYNKNVKFVKRIEGKTTDNFFENFEMILDSGEILRTQKLIIATGGKAGVQYGSTGEGYQIAKSLGHTIIKPIPALVQLTTDKDYFKQLKGVRAKGNVTLVQDHNIEILSETGEIQFTEDGVSGICVFNLSRYIRIEDNSGILDNDNKKAEFNRYSVRIDFIPDFEDKKLIEMLILRKEVLKGRNNKDFLNGIINKRLAFIILKVSDINKDGLIEDLTENDINRIVKVLKYWEISITGTKGWKNAQVTSGGISTSEINGKTMESKLIRNLYFAGEIIDIDGKCGGYNLQWAWTSGFLAGKSACL